MSILLFGDIAIPFRESINMDDIKHITKNKIVIANLEGPILAESEIEAFDKYKYNLFTDKKCIDYFKELNINYLSFANNHILDFKQSAKKTISFLEEEKIDYFGTTDKPYIEFTESERKICVWGAVAYITGPTSNKYDRLNEFSPYKMLGQIRDYKIQNPEVYLIVYVHWGYELAKFPQPADREWALRAIDIGVNAVIGLHPHVVQGIEKYNSGIIVYSLGNFILPQVEFSGRVLSYNSSRVNFEIGVEINPANNEILIHNLFYDKKNSKLLYKGKSIGLEGNDTPYINFSNKQYQEWYKEHKNEGEHKHKYNIYPTFNSYFHFCNLEFHFYKYFFLIFRIIRRLIMRMGLHTPYNWE